MKTCIIIPSRIGSTRLPEKPLVKLKGKELFRWVYDGVKNADVKAVYIATDSKKIENACKDHNIPSIMTSSSAMSGTDRVYEAAAKTNYDFIINVQGDEPLMKTKYIDDLLTFIRSFPKKIQKTAIFTIVSESNDPADYANPNVVKVVMDTNNRALYFTRASIPFAREGGFPKVIKHFGIYAYHKSVLKKFTKMEKGHYEDIEKLEQLRWIENGGVIYAQKTPCELYSIDTQADVENFEKMMSSGK